MNIACSELHTLDSDSLAIMRDTAEVLNSPPFVTPDATGLLNSSQVNASRVKAVPTSLTESIGKAGDVHADGGDDAMALSVLFPLGDLGAPSACRSGNLFIPEVRLYFELDEFSCNMFNGLRRHGASPPSPTTIQSWRRWMTRFNYVAYAKLSVFNRLAPPSLFGRISSGDKEKIATLPTREVDHDVRRVLNYPTDGVNIMTPPQLVDFITRDLSMFLHQVKRSANPSLQLQINHEAIFQSISFEYKGQRISPTNWQYNPATSSTVEVRRREILDKAQVRRTALMLSMPTQRSRPEVKNIIQRMKDGESHHMLCRTVTDVLHRWCCSPSGSSSCAREAREETEGTA